MMIDTPKELSAALHKTGGEVAVTHSLYWHYLEVLPPRVMGSNFFVFQEGDGEKLQFTKRGDQYYCHLLGDYLVTEDWKIHAAVGRRELNQPFKLLFVFTDDETCDVPDEFREFIGKEFVSVSAIAAAMNVTFRI